MAVLFKTCLWKLFVAYCALFFHWYVQEIVVGGMQMLGFEKFSACWAGKSSFGSVRCKMDVKSVSAVIGLATDMTFKAWFHLFKVSVALMCFTTSISCELLWTQSTPKDTIDIFLLLLLLQFVNNWELNEPTNWRSGAKQQQGQILRRCEYCLLANV